MWKQIVNDYFLFTRKERRGTIYILIIIASLILFPFVYSSFQKEKTFTSNEFKEEIAALRIDTVKKKDFAKYAQDEYYNDYTPNKKRSINKAVSFEFDPNTASVEDLVKLGIREKVALNMQKYISKGGKFSKPEDLKKIWGIPKTDVDRLMPFVKIVNKPSTYPKYEKETYTSNYKPRTISTVDINTGDTSAYISLPGIGSKLSQRIIAFREKLGGFHSIDQVAETFLLPDSTFQKIRPYLTLANASVKKININIATIDEMKTHPYIRYQVANALLNYRAQHGDFNSIDDVKKIMIITDEIFDKMAPYLSVK